MKPEKLAKIQAELKEIAAKEVAFKERLLKYQQDNAIEYFTRPNPPQRKLLEAWGKEQYKVFTFTGANRIGKTTIATIIGIATMRGFWPWDNTPLVFPHKDPRKIRYIGQAWETHIKTVVEPALKRWWPKAVPVETKKNNQGIDAVWRDKKTGSTLEILSNNQDSDTFEGWEGDLVIYDEPPSRDNRIACARGLVDRRGRELFVATLLKEAWIHREIIRMKDADGRPDPSVFNVHAEIDENIGFGLTQEGVDQFDKSLRADERQARLKGIPSYMSTLVWGKFDREVHIKEDFKIPLDWIVDVQIDFHPAKPWYIQFLATDKRNFKYVCHEIVEKGNPKYIAEKIIRHFKQNMLRPGVIQIDPLAKGDPNADDDTVYEKLFNIFASHGFVLETASKDKENGITAINDWLLTENEMPCLFFFRSCKHTIQQVEDYMYDPDTLKPSKEDDDMCECLYRHGLLNTQWYNTNLIDDSKVGKRLL